jgi:type I restriction enzyme, S subunit
MGEFVDTVLGDVLELKRGYDLPQQDRLAGTVPIVSSSGITASHSNAMVRGPGVITGRYGTLGLVFYVIEDFWPLNTTLYVRDFKGNDRCFISYFLRSLDFNAYSDKAAVPGLNRNHLHLAPVRYPSDIDDQRAIASILGALDDKINLNRRMNETLEAMARAIFKDWFVDFGPTRSKVEGSAPYLASEIWSVFPARRDADGKPEGWEIGRLEDVAEITMGASPDGDTYNDRGEGIPLVNGPAEYGDFFLRRIKWTTAPNKLSRRGDLIVCVRGSTTGRHAFADGEYCLGRGVASIRGKSNQQEFADSCLLEHLNRLLQRTTGSVFPNLSADDFRRFDILLPSDAARKAYCEAVRSMRLQIWANVVQSNTLATLRDLLLPKLMSGEIHVKAAEKMLEAAV